MLRSRLFDPLPFLFSIAIVAIHGADLAVGQVENVAGSVTIVSPPASVYPGDYESSSEGFLFVENESLVLGEGILVDISEPGIVGSLDDLTPLELTAGRNISGIYLHFDPLRATGGNVTISGTITFVESVLGIVYRTVSLIDPDADAARPSGDILSDGCSGIGIRCGL